MNGLTDNQQRLVKIIAGAFEEALDEIDQEKKHYHIMDSSYGDVLDRPIKTESEAIRQLRKESRQYFAPREGKATEGMYFIDDEEIMLSIYECTGEQPCPLDEE